jgi:hypothetical protein
MQRVKGNEQHHSSERVEKSAQKKAQNELDRVSVVRDGR